MSQMRKIGSHKTSVYNGQDYIRVQYHDTSVLQYWRDTKKLMLDTGGWFTPTTKTRMNQALNQFGLGGRVSQIKGKWFYNDQPFTGSIFGTVLA